MSNTVHSFSGRIYGSLPHAYLFIVLSDLYGGQQFCSIGLKSNSDLIGQTDLKCVFQSLYSRIKGSIPEKWRKNTL